jgi:hypothetical protein
VALKDLGLMKVGKIIDRLSNCQLLKKESSDLVVYFKGLCCAQFL